MQGFTLPPIIRGVVNWLLVASFMLADVPAHAALTDGLIAYYPFNGNANDESGNGNNGTVNGATLTADRFGNANQAYYFDGNSYIMVANSPSLAFSGDFSIAFWMQGERNASTDVTLITKRRICGYDPFFDIKKKPSTDFIEFEVCNGVDTTGVNSNPENNSLWHYILFIREGSILKAFTDQNLSDERNINDPYNIVNNAPLQFSNGPCIGVIGTVRFIGKLDDLRFYNRAITSAEIQQLYQEGITTAPAVSTDAPSLITATSAILKGTVNPNGADTLVNFDFGATTAYGQNLDATPASTGSEGFVCAVSSANTVDRGNAVMISSATS